MCLRKYISSKKEVAKAMAENPKIEMDVYIEEMPH